MGYTQPKEFWDLCEFSPNDHSPPPTVVRQSEPGRGQEAQRPRAAPEGHLGAGEEVQAAEGRAD